MFIIMRYVLSLYKINIFYIFFVDIFYSKYNKIKIYIYIYVLIYFYFKKYFSIFLKILCLSSLECNINMYLKSFIISKSFRFFYILSK